MNNFPPEILEAVRLAATLNSPTPRGRTALEDLEAYLLTALKDPTNPRRHRSLEKKFIKALLYQSITLDPRVLQTRLERTQHGLTVLWAMPEPLTFKNSKIDCILRGKKNGH